MQTRDVVQVRELSQCPECLDEALYTAWKKCAIAFIKYFSKIRANLKRHNRAHILSSTDYTPLIDQ